MSMEEIIWMIVLFLGRGWSFDVKPDRITEGSVCALEKTILRRQSD